MWGAAMVRVARWDAIARSPRALRRAQEETLLAHVRASARTELGRAHGFDRIRSYDDFARQVPVRTYADYEASLERMRRGARDVLYPGLVEHWGQSSGTSHTAQNNKFLPISRAQIRWQQLAGFDVLARYLVLSGDRDFPGGFMLGLFPPSTIERVGPVGIASNPGIMQRNLPYLARRMQLPRPPIRDIADYDAKLDAIAEAYLDHDVRMLSGTTCWFSVLFDRLLAASRRRGRDVRCVADLWPNLRVLLGGGVPSEPYRELVRARIGRPVALLETYSATEGGFFATADTLTDSAMRMIPDRGVFFELVAQDDRSRRRVPLWDAAPGVVYEVVLTTSSGLFAYAIGDHVRFDETYPHRMRFVGRAAGVLSLTQELTTTSEIEQAVAHAARMTHATTIDFAATSEVGVGGTARGRYVLFVELEGPVPDRAAFAQAFDEALCARNRVYREHRQKDVAILPPQVFALTPGATRQFMRELGPTSFQQKFPRILDAARSERLRRYVIP